MPLIESFSGIRGIYDNGIDGDVAVKYAYSYLWLLKKKYGNNLKIVVGTDTRPSKDIIKNFLIGALDCDIIDTGTATTPMAEFAVRHFKANGGIIVTASHNEPYWNGFKFLDNDGGVLSPKDMEKVIQKYHKIARLGNKKSPLHFLYKNNKKPKTKNVYRRYNETLAAYSDYVLKFLSVSEISLIRDSKIKILIDPNGGAGVIAKKILENTGAKVYGVNMEYGIFNRKVEPDGDSMLYLANIAREKNCDFAAGFDCDADRVEIATSNGLINGNYLFALIAEHILKNAKNKAIVVNDATSSMLREIAEKHNAKYIETDVGETNVVNKIYKLRAPIGGEASSSGIIIPPSRCRDGILALIFLLKIIAGRKKKLDELIRALPEYHTVTRNISFDSESFNMLVRKLFSYYIKKHCKIKKSKTGSLKIILSKKSFVWLRLSKTEPNILRLIADAPKKEQAELIMVEALGLAEGVT